MLIYKPFLFVLYVLTNYFIVCYNYNVVGNPTEQYRRTFFLQEISYRFSSKTVFFPKRAVKTKCRFVNDVLQKSENLAEG